MSDECWDEEASGTAPAASEKPPQTQDVNNNTFKPSFKGDDSSRGSAPNFPRFNKGFKSNSENNDSNAGGYQRGDRNNGSNDNRYQRSFKPRDNEDSNRNEGGKYGGGGFRPRNNDNNDSRNDGQKFGGYQRNNERNNEGGKFGMSRRNNDDNNSERRDYNRNDNNDRGSKPFGNKGEGYNRRPRDNNNENSNENNSPSRNEHRGFRKNNDENNGGGNGFGGYGRNGDRDSNRSSFANKDRDSNRPSYGDRDRDSNRKSFGNRDSNDNDNEGKRGFRSDNNERGPRRDNGDKNGEDDKEVKKENYIPPALNEDEDFLFKSISAGVNFAKQDEMPAKLTGEGSEEIAPLKTFADANFSDLLMQNVTKSGYTVPTPVQKYGIPVVLKGRDLMACAQTGSGKTAAYVLPIMTRILQDGIVSSGLMAVQTPQALILSPTRELAIQIFKECRKFSYHSMIKTQILYGGTNTAFQISEISRGTNILVATPGRLIDVLNKGKISLEKVKYFVLDEADRMLDLGFGPNVREILGKCTSELSNINILMYSATFPEEIQKLAQDFLKNYLFLTIGTVGGANADVKQSIAKVTRFEKRDKLVEILNEIGNERTMVFIEHKKQADVLAFFLCQKGYPATSLHGDRLQSQRETALNEFKTGAMKIIVCTSVAARGLDISDVNHVINYDLPQSIDEYVHRIGRTGRCGNIGKAISFFDSENENDRKLARSLVKTLIQAGSDVPDWLTSAAEDCYGSSFANNDCKNDLRDGFKSMSLNSKETKVPEVTEEESW